MGGPNLEVFKFGIYVFFPVAMMIYYGDPDWYNKHVLTVSFPKLPTLAFIEDVSPSLGLV